VTQRREAGDETQGLRPAPLEPTGIEGAAQVFAVAAFASVAAGLALDHAGWPAPVAGMRFFFFGLELAAAAVTAATVALALGPIRGCAAARKAWLSGGAALALVLAGMVWIIPALLAPVASP
jgi:hypothetical protein